MGLGLLDDIKSFAKRVTISLESKSSIGVQAGLKVDVSSNTKKDFKVKGDFKINAGSIQINSTKTIYY